MIDDFDDYDPPRSRPSDPVTSHLAEPSEAVIAREALRYLRILVKEGPQAPFQVSEKAGREMWRRNIDLKRKGLSEETGVKVLNPETMRMCMQHQATVYGRLIASKRP